MKVRSQSTRGIYKIFFFENGVRIKGPALGSCIYVARALYLMHSSQENVAESLG